MEGIRNVVRATLVVYKDEPEFARLAPADLDDLRYLIQHEVARRQLQVSWINRMAAASAIDRSSLRQALLNLLLNACAASPVRGEVRFEAWFADGCLGVAITDSGPGLPAAFAAMLERSADAMLPPGEHGLGIWTSSRLIKAAGGRFEVGYPDGGGTRIIVPRRDEEALDEVA